MSMKSIAKRIHRAIFVITLVCIVAMVLSVLLVNESLEDAMLQVEITEDQNFFLTHKKDDAPVIWESPNLIIAHLRSEEHTYELQSLMRTSYAVFCLKQKKY